MGAGDGGVAAAMCEVTRRPGRSAGIMLLASLSRQKRKEKEGKRSKIPVLATVVSTAVIFWITPLSRKLDRKSASCRFWCCRPLDVAATPPGLYVRGFTCRVK